MNYPAAELPKMGTGTLCFYRCFTDNLNQSNQSKLQNPVMLEFCPTFASNQCYCFLRMIEHVLESDHVIMLRHIAHLPQ